MRRVRIGSLAVVLSGAVAVASGCGSKTTATTSTAAPTTSSAAPVAAVTPSVPPPVPLRAQRAIKRSAGIYAYVPGRVPVGYRFDQWQYRSTTPGTGLMIWFRHNGQVADFTFNAGTQTNNCPGGKTLWLHGGRVYWSGNNENDQYMWVCEMGPNHRVIQLMVDTAPSTQGGASVTTLAAVLHSAHPIR